MSEMTSDQSLEEVERLQDEVDRLRAENEELSATVTEETRSGGRARTRWAVLLAVIAAIFFALAVPALWLNRVVFDTDTWVATVAPLAQDPAIQDAVAQASSGAIIERLDAQTRLETLLPEQLKQFAPILASSVESAIRSQATSIVRSERFAQLWTELNRNGHEAFIAGVTGRQGVVSVQSGTFTLDVGLLADEIKSALEDRGLGFVSRIPTQNIDRQVVLYQSDALRAAGPILDAVQAAALYIPLIGLVLVAGAFGLAADRRRVALWFGLSVAILAILPLQMLYFGQLAVVQQVTDSAGVSSAAAQNAFEIIFRQFVTSERTLAFLGFLIWTGAILAGPRPWAVALRSGVTGGLSSAGAHLELGRFGEWVADHKSGLRPAGFVLAALVLLLLPAPRTIGEIVGVAIGAVVWLLAVDILGAARPLESSDERRREAEHPSDGPPAALI